MSETAAAASKKRGYTRRTTRDRVVDLLEQAIELVKARCVDPERNAAVAAAEKLAASKKEFAAAVELKKKENLAATAPVVTAPAATAPVTAPLAATAFPTVTAAPATKATKATKGTKGAAAKTKTLAPLKAAAAAPVVNNTRRVKKAPSCPGGPKAFNEFLRAKRDEVEAELGPNAKYPNVRARIAELWKESCPKPPTQTRKVTTKATPGRVNAVVPGALSPLGEVSESKETEIETEPELEAAEAAAAGGAAEEAAAEGAAAEEGEEENLGYEDLGIDPMFEMRKIRVDGRDLYMADANSSLFDRNDEDDDPLGEFVGYLRDGEIVEEEAPNV